VNQEEEPSHELEKCSHVLMATKYGSKKNGVVEERAARPCSSGNPPSASHSERSKQATRAGAHMPVFVIRLARRGSIEIPIQDAASGLIIASRREISQGTE